MATAFNLDPAYRRISVEEFLDLEFFGAKAELEDGLIFMMAGGSPDHALIAGNILTFLRTKLRGSGCLPYGSDLAVRTGERSTRFPDVSVYCRTLSDEERSQKLIGDPQLVFEVLSPSTASLDQKTKLPEYQGLAGVQEIVFVDLVAERVRLVRRTHREGWADNWLEHGADVQLPSLGLTMPHADIFARD